MSYDVLKQTTTTIFIHKTITFTRGPGPSLTTLGTPSPKRPRAMGWRDIIYTSYYVIRALNTLFKENKTDDTFTTTISSVLLYSIVTICS